MFNHNIIVLCIKKMISIKNIMDPKNIEEEINQLTSQLEPLSLKTERPMTKRSIVYWGIEINPNDILNIPEIAACLAANPALVPNKRMHTTLKWVGRKSNYDDSEFVPLVDKDCHLFISLYGVSEKALALSVDDMSFVDSDLGKVPSYPNEQQHITVALAEGEKAVNSVQTLKKDTYNLSQKVQLNGKLQGYKY
jgi:hypothetical protein